MINQRIIFLFFIACLVSCHTNTESYPNNSKKGCFEYKGDYIYNGVDDIPSKDGFVYIYDEDCYTDSLCNDFIKQNNLIDTNFNHQINFMLYAKELPDTLSYSKKSYLLSGEYSDFIELRIYYSKREKNIVTIKYFNITDSKKTISETSYNNWLSN